MGYFDGGSGYESSVGDNIFKQGNKLIADINNPEFQKQRRARDIKEQLNVEEYNKKLATSHKDLRFKDKILCGNNIIVKLEKMDVLVESGGNLVPNQMRIVTVSTPDDPMGKVIANPLPYNFRGVVIKVGDEIIAERAAKGLIPIEEGDWVELTWFELKNSRYYSDKDKIDLITLNNPIAPNYEGFALVNMRFVEMIIKDFEASYGVRPSAYYDKYSKTTCQISYKEFDEELISTFKEGENRELSDKIEENIENNDTENNDNNITEE